MDWDLWKPWYADIISDFGYDPNQDMKCAVLLNDIIKKQEIIENLNYLKSIIEGKIVFIYGCGPSLPKHIELIIQSDLLLSKFTHIAADGATTALLEKNLVPQIIISDLDGRIEDLKQANKQGALLIVHAHGDNINKIKQFTPLFSGKLLGTTQNKPLSNVKNYGGFTDGDRCVFLAEEMGASIIILLGFDFGKVMGKFSKPYLKENTITNEVKFKKLKWAQKLISELSLTTHSQIISVNGNKENFGKVINYNFAEFKENLKRTIN
ncbi:MAG: 6-hydroxymethylpterin diphosphokinase MptE-like protein [Candidatus Helarchaeota archaeon]